MGQTYRYYASPNYRVSGEDMVISEYDSRALAHTGEHPGTFIHAVWTGFFGTVHEGYQIFSSFRRGLCDTARLAVHGRVLARVVGRRVVFTRGKAHYRFAAVLVAFSADALDDQGEALDFSGI